MPKTTKSKKTKSSKSERATERPVVATMGCPRGVGPEVCVGAAFALGAPACVVVGSRAVLQQAAFALGISARKWRTVRDFDLAEGRFSGLRVLSIGPELDHNATSWGRPDAAAGVAQLKWVEEGYRLARQCGWPLVTGPVSKEAIARSGLKRARSFRGHTEWLQKLDGAAHSVMCFSSSKLTCSLVTTHVPIRALPRALTAAGVTQAILELADLLLRRGQARPRLAVCSLNPHGGEGELLGKEESSVIVPGVDRAAELLGRRARLEGPLGAETAFRRAAAGGYAGVVAMYHDQATIPMKLLDFGGAVNVTQGLSIVRTSVDHGTAYDIAGKGLVDSRGMSEAMHLAARLATKKRRIEHGNW